MTREEKIEWILNRYEGFEDFATWFRVILREGFTGLDEQSDDDLDEEMNTLGYRGRHG